MTMYPYTIQTEIGTSIVVTDETNIPANIPPRTLVSIHNPSQELITRRRAIIARPVRSTARSYETDIDQFKGTTINDDTNLPIIIGAAIDERDLPSNATLAYVQIPGTRSISVALIILIVLIVVGIAAVVAAAWVANNYIRYKEHQFDALIQSQQPTSYKEYDLNGDGVMDVLDTTYGNGDVIRSAISEYGMTQYPKPVNIREGFDTNALLNNLTTDAWLSNIVWPIVIIAGVGVSGYVIYKVVKSAPPLPLPSRPQGAII